MSNCPLCNLQPALVSSEAKRATGFFRRAWQSIQWIFPSTLLVLMPKCPFCVAAYVALFTGVSISVTTARWLQVLMFVLCLASLTYIAVRKGRAICNFFARRKAHES
jgi:hypothetical protein